MRVSTFVLAVLAGHYVGCKPVEDCSPTEEVAVDEALRESDIQGMLDDLALDDRADISCEDACEYVYYSDRGWLFNSATDCTLQIDEAPGADPDVEVGSVRCHVSGQEYDCG